MMLARIYRPAKSAMQSGKAQTKKWRLEFEPALAPRPDALMGWISSADPSGQVRMSFDTKEAALDYAKAQGIDAVVQEPHKRKQNIRPGGYGDNFATSRRQVWTH